MSEESLQTKGTSAEGRVPTAALRGERARGSRGPHGRLTEAEESWTGEWGAMMLTKGKTTQRRRRKEPLVTTVRTWLAGSTEASRGPLGVVHAKMVPSMM